MIDNWRFAGVGGLSYPIWWGIQTIFRFYEQSFFISALFCGEAFQPGHGIVHII